MAKLRDIIAGLGGSWKIAPGGELAPSTRKATQADLDAAILANPAAATNPPFKPGDTIPDMSVMQVTLVDPEGNPRYVKFNKPTSLNGPVPAEEVADTLDLTLIDAGEPAPGGTKTPAEQNEAIAKAQADRVAAEARAAQEQAALKKAQEDQREAEYNQQQGNGYLTHAQLAAQQKAIQEGKISADQVDVQRRAMENNNANTIVQNQIAAANAATAAQNAASTSRANEARIMFEQKGQEFEQGAKFAYQQAQDEIKQQNELADRTQRELQQAQTNAVQVQQNAIRSQELGQKTASEAASLEQRKAEAAQTAQTAATTAAANVYGTERQAQSAAAQTGAGLINQRVQAGQGMLSSALSLAGQRPMVGLQPGAGAALLGDIQNFTAQLGGGQDVYDTAARLVTGADSQNGASPMAQQAFGLLTQVFDRYQQQNNQPHPAVAATAAAKASQANNAVVAPVTAPLATPGNPNPIAAPVVPQVVAAQQSAAASPLPMSPMIAPQQGMAALFPGGFRSPLTRMV